MDVHASDTTKSSDAIQQRLSSAILLGSAYCFLAAWLYLIGFWGHFDVNVFEYLGFNDVIKLGTSRPGPIFLFALSAVLGALIPKIGEGPEGSGGDKPIVKWIGRHASILAVVWMASIIAIAMFDNELLWRSLGVILIAVPIGVVLMGNKLVRSHVEHVIGVLRLKYPVRVYPKPELEGHEEA